ncbi:hypothetical protein GCM10009122_57380 [Fulvivirga kasyanovii]
MRADSLLLPAKEHITASKDAESSARDIGWEVEHPPTCGHLPRGRINAVEGFLFVNQIIEVLLNKIYLRIWKKE